VASPLLTRSLLSWCSRIILITVLNNTMIKFIHYQPRCRCQDCQRITKSGRRSRHVGAHSLNKPFPHIHEPGTLRQHGPKAVAARHDTAVIRRCTVVDLDTKHPTSPSLCPSYIALNLYPVDPSPSVILAMQYCQSFYRAKFPPPPDVAQTLRFLLVQFFLKNSSQRDGIHKNSSMKDSKSPC
jgi:hypothetical protein